VTSDCLLVTDRKLGATIACAAFLGVVRVDRLALTEADNAIDLAGADAMRGQVVVDDLGATLGKLLVVLVATDRVGMAVELNADVRVARQDVNRLIKQYEQMETVMKKMRKMGVGGMLGAMKGLMGKGDQDRLSELQAQEGMSSLPGMPGTGMPNMGAMRGLPGLGGFSHGGTKKNRKKR